RRFPPKGEARFPVAVNPFWDSRSPRIRRQVIHHESKPLPETHQMTQIGHPNAAIRAHEELFSYWASLRGEAPVPARGRLDPRDMTRLLPTVSLTEVLPGEAIDFRI